MVSASVIAALWYFTHFLFYYIHIASPMYAAVINVAESLTRLMLTWSWLPFLKWLTCKYEQGSVLFMAFLLILSHHKSKWCSRSFCMICLNCRLFVIIENTCTSDWDAIKRTITVVFLCGIWLCFEKNYPHFCYWCFYVGRFE